MSAACGSMSVAKCTTVFLGLRLKAPENSYPANIKVKKIIFEQLSIDIFKCLKRAKYR